MTIRWDGIYFLWLATPIEASRGVREGKCHVSQCWIPINVATRNGTDFGTSWLVMVLPLTVSDLG